MSENDRGSMRSASQLRERSRAALAAFRQSIERHRKPTPKPLVHIRTITIEEAEREIADTIASTGMTREQLEDAQSHWDLDADRRDALARVHTLEWLIGKAELQRQQPDVLRRADRRAAGGH